MMNAAQRREALLQILQQSKEPVRAGTLAAQLGVSRQVIVGDIALLRAAGADIYASPRGYLPATAPQGLLFTVATVHDSAGIGEELYAMVEEGCQVLDVIVEHPIYGQITAPLQLRNHSDVDHFVKSLESKEAPPLSSLTNGIHLHTLCCPDEKTLQRVRERLRKLHFLLES